MSNLYIIKGSIKNVVTEELFNRVYKPNGWVIDATMHTPEQPVEATLKNETEVKNYTKAKKKTDKVFNDNLIKKGE